MNPNRDGAVETRRKALVDQIDGLEQRSADGRDEPHVRRRLADSKAEFAVLEERRCC